ncbi:uncharacterized protein LOC125501065 [Athalia rosae]|uniref:uncharacterized protein LOC125501065 n=1 Tax=Athalia rosae TaxID=37344 RepID=UPI0020348D0C|nr:uncharacterized protein LOC125501065 [Athalia rosae]
MLLLLLIIIPGNTLVAYDCGGGALNITTINLLEPQECHLKEQQPEVTKPYVQLLQLSNFKKTKAIQCRIEIDRTVYHCGMHSHTSITAHGRQAYIKEVSREACSRRHEYGIAEIAPNKPLTNIPQNGTTRLEITLAGNVEPDGTCEGAFYDDLYGQWSNVVVQAIIKITLSSQEATINLEYNKITFENGLSCELQRKHCSDEEGGNPR